MDSDASANAISGSPLPGPGLLGLPKEVLRTVASFMTTREWAASGAGACQLLNQLELNCIEVVNCSDESSAGTCYSEMLWASKRWDISKQLNIIFPAYLDERQTAALIALVQVCHPQCVERLELDAYDLLNPHKPSRARYVFKLLLDGLADHGRLETLRIRSAVQHLPMLESLRRLHLELTLNSHWEVSSLLAQLPALQYLDISWTWRLKFKIFIELSELENLEYLTLTSLTPAVLEVPPGCRVSIREHYTGKFWDMPLQDCECADSIDVLFSKSFGSIPSYSYLQGLRVLDCRLNTDRELPVFDASACLALRSLETLRVSAVLAPEQTLQIRIPARFSVKSLIVRADRIHLDVKSPRSLSMSLDEFILASHIHSEQVDAPVPLAGGDFHTLANEFGRQGFAVHTARSPAQQCGHSPGQPCAFVYVVKQGPLPRSSHELFKRVCRCLCGQCWCCQLEDGDLGSVGFPDDFTIT